MLCRKIITIRMTKPWTVVPAAVIPSESTDNTVIDRQKIFYLIHEQTQIVRIGPETSAKSVL